MFGIEVIKKIEKHVMPNTLFSVSVMIFKQVMMPQLLQCAYILLNLDMSRNERLHEYVNLML
jgi:hypothetical protein